MGEILDVGEEAGIISDYLLIFTSDRKVFHSLLPNFRRGLRVSLFLLSQEVTEGADTDVIFRYCLFNSYSTRRNKFR